jgi:hypothetical protein
VLNRQKQPGRKKISRHGVAKESSAAELQSQIEDSKFKMTEKLAKKKNLGACNLRRKKV